MHRLTTEPCVVHRACRLQQQRIRRDRVQGDLRGPRRRPRIRDPDMAAGRGTSGGAQPHGHADRLQPG